MLSFSDIIGVTDTEKQGKLTEALRDRVRGKFKAVKVNNCFD